MPKVVYLFLLDQYLQSYELFGDFELAENLGKPTENPWKTHGKPMENLGKTVENQGIT